MNKFMMMLLGLFVAFNVNAADTKKPVENKASFIPISFSPAGGYRGVVNDVSLKNNQLLHFHFRPHRLGIDRFNLFPPVIPGVVLDMTVACVDIPDAMSCHDVYDRLSDASNFGEALEFVVTKNAGGSYISEFVEPSVHTK